ncbi:immunity 22 family protein [Clostridium aciditolerans]|uniref:Immunity 22 family protein n=1 Tax=Clostridium aciditolerans TaxID=339861 RepID=A0A934HNG3_9CLOT|nr:immunity 22 family protein [Clostridium aciditolerans]MBI6871355.1 immunity 22 family protein [Clostridium aciditolerans]
MEISGLVSLWIGNFNSITELKNYVCLGYTADGDQIYSKFANEFDFGHTDDDSIEYEFYNEKLIVIKDLLKPFSYSNIIIHRFENLLGKNKFDKPVNSLILLYDYKHEEDIIKGTNIEYVGCVSYL